MEHDDLKMRAIHNPQHCLLVLNPRISELRIGLDLPIFYDFASSQLCLDTTPAAMPSLVPIDSLVASADGSRIEFRTGGARRRAFTISSDRASDQILFGLLGHLHDHGCPPLDGAASGIEIGFLDGAPREVILERTEPDMDASTVAVFWRDNPTWPAAVTRQVPLLGTRIPVKQLTIEGSCFSVIDQDTTVSFPMTGPQVVVQAASQLLALCCSPIQP